ncbi:MAG: HK97 gp10 family phage protein [Pseudomonadota bacterium]
MSIKITGLDNVLADLEGIKREVPKAAKQSMRHHAKLIAEQAARNAPVKGGYLENSLRILDEKETPRRITITVGVDESRLGPGYQLDGFEYHVQMHEGAYNLGPRSQAKADAGNDVGPLYLDRAAWQYEPELRADIQDKVDKAIR